MRRAVVASKEDRPLQSSVFLGRSSSALTKLYPPDLSSSQVITRILNLPAIAPNGA